MTPAERMAKIGDRYSDWIGRDTENQQLPGDIRWMFLRIEKLERLAEAARDAVPVVGSWHVTGLDRREKLKEAIAALDQP